MPQLFGLVKGRYEVINVAVFDVDVFTTTTYDVTLMIEPLIYVTTLPQTISVIISKDDAGNPLSAWELSNVEASH
ncbi:MAG: hypothetical protein ACRCTP_02255 [Aeromonas popoffii]|uniref:hypothetical protein n=1 Tax=Aeromonas popoffii TaxID=70856 RepID=UPI003F2AC64B